jgi:hypothetical protein
VVQILQIAVPLAGAVTIAALPAAQQNDAQNRLEIMKDIVAALPTGQEDRIGDGLPERAGRLTTAQGAALRAIRAIIFENDPCTPSADCAESRPLEAIYFGSADTTTPTTTQACLSSDRQAKPHGKYAANYFAAKTAKGKYCLVNPVIAVGLIICR